MEYGLCYLLTFLLYLFYVCIQDTLTSHAALGLPAVQSLGRVRRASKGILHTRFMLVHESGHGLNSVITEKARSFIYD